MPKTSLAKKYLFVVALVNFIPYLSITFFEYFPGMVDKFPFLGFVLISTTIFTFPWIIVCNIMSIAYARKMLRPFDSYSRMGLLLSIGMLVMLVALSILGNRLGPAR